jgi:hypothetical protein
MIQNTHTVQVTFLGLTGNTSLALMLLIAAVGGILLTLILGSARILQLRHTGPHTPLRSHCISWSVAVQGSCKVLRQAVDLLGCRRGEAAIRCRIWAVASTDRRQVALTWAGVECSPSRWSAQRWLRRPDAGRWPP